MMTAHDVDRYRTEYGYQVTCLQCRCAFDSKRGDASFCNSTCRSKYNRAQKKRQRTRDNFDKALTEMLLQLPRRGHSKDLDVLQVAATRISKALEIVES